MRKRIIIFITLILSCLINKIYAEHISFYGVEMGTHPERFKSLLKQNGLEQIDEDDDVFYGNFFGVECKIILKELDLYKNNWMLEDQREISEIDILYNFPKTSKYPTYYNWSKADSIKDVIVNVICDSFLSQGYQPYITNDHPYARFGTLIIIKDAWVTVCKDVSSIDLNNDKCSIWIRIYDVPNNFLFYQIQESNQEIDKNANTHKQKSKKRKKRR